jgi:hypothetical protein
MKNICRFLALALVSVVMTQGIVAQEKSAQEKSAQEKSAQEKSVREKQLIEERKALEEAMKKREELYEKRIEGQSLLLDSLRIYYDLKAENIRDAVDAARIAYDVQGNYAVVGEGLVFLGSVRSPGNSSSVQYSKRFDKSSMKSDFSFEIEEDAGRASISVSGHCNEGEVSVSITSPDGKLYTEVKIDDMGSVDWNKSFNLGGENDDKTGTWKFNVQAREATGSIRIALRSNGG